MLILILNIGKILIVLLISGLAFKFFEKILGHLKSVLLYPVLYISDVLKKDFLVFIADSINEKHPIIKNSCLFTYIKWAMKTQDSCIYYENPIYACLSCYTYNILYIWITKRFSLVDAFIIQAFYASIYCVGMQKRCKEKENFAEMLKNNITCLKYIFLPIKIPKAILAFTIKNVIPIVSLIGVSVIARMHIDTAILVQWIDNYGTRAFSWMVIVALYVFALPMPTIMHYIIKTMYHTEKHET